MGKVRPKSWRRWKRGTGAISKTIATNRTMRSIGATVDLWRSHARPGASAFTAHLCVGKGRSKGYPKFCGMAAGKNPRAAIANAAHDLARTMESRSGAFAGYSKTNRRVRRTRRASKRSY